MTHVERKRLWVVPPALVRDAGEPLFEGGAILSETGGTLGLVLWQSVRDVLLWSQASDRQRAHLFSPDAAERRRQMLMVCQPLPKALEGPLHDLASLVAQVRSIESRAISTSCGACSLWAEGARKPLTALAFAQTAAIAWPAGAAPALALGSLALRLGGRDVRAESWLLRAIRLAVRSKDRRIYAEASLSLAEVVSRRGVLRDTHQAYDKALTAARRAGLRNLRVRCHVELSKLAVHARDLDAAERHLRAAVRSSRTRDPGAAAVLIELGRLHLLKKNVGVAVAVLQSLLRRSVGPSEGDRALALSLIADAFAIGDLPNFPEAFESARTALDALRPGRVSAEVAITLGQAAVRAGRDDLLPTIAIHLERIAGDREIVHAATQLRRRVVGSL